MYYVIQEKLFREENYENLIRTLEKFELDYEVVKLNPDDDTINIHTDRKDIFPFGAVRMAKIARKYEWNPGSFMNENHDYEVYSKYYGDNLLNADSKVMKVKDVVPHSSFFARPTKDTKAFTGRVFKDKDDWEIFLEKLYLNPRSILTSDTLVQVASVKKILNEIRFWIVKGEIVTASIYNMYGNYHLSEDVDDDAYEFVKQMIKLYEVNDTFVMDICLTYDGYKIIECNCTNSAGFYKANMGKLIMALEDAFNTK